MNVHSLLIYVLNEATLLSQESVNFILSDDFDPPNKSWSIKRFPTVDWIVWQRNEDKEHGEFRSFK